MIGLIDLLFKILGSGVPGYAKVPKEALLEHTARAMIGAKVDEDPGITPAELSEDLEIPYTTVDYHVRRLEQEHLIASHLDGRRKHLYSSKVAPVDRARLAMLRNANTVRLLDEIRHRPGLHQRALAAAIEIRPTSLAWHLARLEGSGLVRSARTGRSVVWFTNDPIEAATAR